MIQHIVMLQLTKGHDAVELTNIMDGLGALQIDGFTAFSHGPNHDLEGKTPDYPYGFICTFDNLDALRRYADDADHHALGGRLCDLCVGGGDGIMVMDLAV